MNTSYSINICTNKRLKFDVHLPLTNIFNKRKGLNRQICYQTVALFKTNQYNIRHINFLSFA